jgi:hypothetical protein
MTLVLMMGASGVVLAAAAAHAKSGMGLDGAGYLLLFHAVAVLSGVALLQQGLLLRPLVLGVLSGWVPCERPPVPIPLDGEVPRPANRPRSPSDAPAGG